jgi:protein-S-isoprenylcysteine O-methyltransferase Ste14
MTIPGADAAPDSPLLVGGGFDLDDPLYLHGLAVWFGWLTPLLIGGAIVAPVMALLTLWRLRRMARRRF